MNLTPGRGQWAVIVNKETTFPPDYPLKVGCIGEVLLIASRDVDRWLPWGNKLRIVCLTKDTPAWMYTHNLSANVPGHKILQEVRKYPVKSLLVTSPFTQIYTEQLCHYAL